MVARRTSARGARTGRGIPPIRGVLPAVFLLAVVAATALLAGGCVRSVAGNGTMAEGSSVLVPPTDSAASTGAAGGATGSDAASSGTSAVCQVLDKAKLAKVFDETVTLGRSQSSGCVITGSAGRSMIVAVFDALRLADYKRGTYATLTVTGHQAVRTTTDILYVARATSGDTSGLVAVYFSGMGADGVAAATVVASQLLEKFGK